MTGILSEEKEQDTDGEIVGGDGVSAVQQVDQHPEARELLPNVGELLVRQHVAGTQRPRQQLLQVSLHRPVSVRHVRPPGDGARHLLRSAYHVIATSELSKCLPSKPGVGNQSIALRASAAARNFPPF